MVHVFFDGHCNLCNGFVDFLIRRDHRNRIKFGSLQSAAFQPVFTAHPELAKVDSVIALEPETGRVFVKSDAALRTLRELGGLWPLMGIFRIFPRVMRDWAYDVVARNRYRIFGRSDSCRLPTPEERAHFL